VPAPETAVTTIQKVCVGSSPTMRDMVGALKFHSAFHEILLFQPERVIGEVTDAAKTVSETSAVPSTGYWEE
jgi:hypothetical protein